ncbi:hypothetical protein DAETH_47990 (plasmid) [Deinococcus aetherius]|uniref:Uncharacterized protein n=1 Tax=Deinococcus aetherius TaxID=200252 RepID=A0ABN6RNF0_9DEIO|nr:hypothetical protein [Deinococcus aetherius]BDP44830.1 hypothetical protein DAETH_47990 [Deinococcus aetherius]
MRLLPLTLLLLGSAAQPAPPPPRYCSVLILRDYRLAVTYQAILRLDPTCPPDGVGRLRKVSTLNWGGPYVPQKPGGLPQYGNLWGWSLTSAGSNVPSRELWTLYSWRWQWYDGAEWQPVVVR